MNTSEELALTGASLSTMVGLVLVFFRQPLSRRIERERERPGAHVGSESHPTMLLLVGLLFVATSVVILVAGTDPLRGEILGREPRSVRDLLTAQPATTTHQDARRPAGPSSIGREPRVHRADSRSPP
jgi:hypothetical protein